MDIMLVDDEDHILRSVGDFLTDFGYGVVPARNGEDALKLLEGGAEVGLIISDIRMPGMDGFELLQAVGGRFSDIPTILITGHREEDNLLKALQFGAYDYLRKPVRLKSLLASIDHLESRKRLRDRLREDRKALGVPGTQERVHAGVVYEIQAPLNLAMETLQRLDIFWKAVRKDLDVAPDKLDGSSVQGEVTELFGSMRRSLGRVDGILHDLGVLSQRAPMAKPKAVNLIGCLKDAAETAWALLPERVHLNEVYEEEVMPVIGDRQDFCHLFAHLFENAALAVSEFEGARIEVRALKEDTGQVCIEVEDNGYGISGAIQNRIFEPFFTTRGEGKGPGLGLAVCRKIVQTYGGDIGFKSSVGGGATFWVRLKDAEETG